MPKTFEFSKTSFSFVMPAIVIETSGKDIQKLRQNWDCDGFFESKLLSNNFLL